MLTVEKTIINKMNGPFKTNSLAQINAPNANVPFDRLL